MYALDFLSGIIRIDEDIKDFLLQHVNIIELSKGALLRAEHSLDRNLYFVESGLLRTFYNEDGKDITLGFVKENGLVASKETLFLERPSHNSIEALEPSIVNALSFTNLQKFAETSISVSKLMVSVIGTLMINLERRIYALQYMTAKERYYQMMEEEPEVILRAPLGAVASYLGMSQETLSRIRK
jgi:CRP-like cAMP-binding protein